jgi:hypothetical protein
VSRNIHSYKGAITNEFACCLRPTFFKWAYLVSICLLLGTLWTFTIGSWFGPWILDQVDRVTDIKFGLRDFRPTQPQSNMFTPGQSEQKQPSPIPASVTIPEATPNATRNTTQPAAPTAPGTITMDKTELADLLLSL